MRNVIVMLCLIALITGCSSDDDSPAFAKDIVLEKTELYLRVSESEVLKYTILPENTENKDVHWSSSNPDIVSVSNGKVTALKIGESIITAEAAGSVGAQVKSTCRVTVDYKEIESLKLNESEMSLIRGTTFKLIPILIPSSNVNTNIRWESSNKIIAEVDVNGMVSAISVGECIIKAISEDGKHEASCKIEVLPISVESISFEKENYIIEVGTEQTLNIVIQPENADNKKVIWESRDPLIATVDNSGKVKAISKGETSIIVKTEDGKVESSCDISVSDIDGLVEIRFVRSGGSIVNGLVIGDITVWITNNSSKPINLTKFYIVDSSNGTTVIEENNHLPQVLNSKEQIPFGYSIYAYRPMGVLEFICEGKQYMVTGSML